MAIAATFIFGLLIVASALLVLGALLPSLFYIGVFGSVALSIFPATVLLASLVSALAVWRLSPDPARWILLSLAALSIIGAAVILSKLLIVARGNGVSVPLTSWFGFGGNWKSFSDDETVEYATDLGEALTLRIYRPAGAPPSGGWPVLMYVHGGGWIEGNNAQRSADWRWFAEHGWLVVSVGYSLSSEKRHLWDRVVPQVGCAMSWTAANISRRGGDPNRIALIGESAGGNLVLNAAYSASAGKLAPICGGALPSVRAVAAIYPGVDLTVIQSRDPLLRRALPKMITGYLGGDAEVFPERYQQVASATHINSKAPPTLVFISENDHLVPSTSMHKFVQDARRGGVRVHAVSVPHAEHGFDAAGIGNRIIRQTTLRFLNRNS